MKNFKNRILAFVLVLAVVLSLLPAHIPAQAATVNYVYAGSYIKNWGIREETATFLSPNAESFYAGNGVTLSALAALSGADSTANVPSSPLYSALHSLMYSNLEDYTTYDETKDLFQYTDCQNSGKLSSSISSFYSGKAIGPAWDSGKTWNREHVWPNSKSNGGSNSNTRRETDIMMLRPASVSENSSRSNTAYGESGSFYHPNEASGGAYDLRGDVARIVLYVYTCWGGSNDFHDGATNYMWGSGGVIESKEVLLNWIAEDPVDTWELGRNDSVESITGTRNVYVDYPELAFLLFNEDIPDNYTSPSGGAMESYTVSAVSSNTAWGSVSVSGNTVTAAPAAGYEVSGYKLLSGSAQVTQSGNTFTVVPSSDVTVQILFSARAQSTIRFAQLGITVDTGTVYTGDTLTLPGHTGAPQTGYTFLGWVENTVEKTQTRPDMYPAGSQYTVTGNTTLHALYSICEGGDSGSSNVFSPYTGALTEGDYIIVYDDCAMVAELTSRNRLQYTQVTYTGTDIVSPGESIIWHLAPDGDHWTMYNAASGKYAGGSGVNNAAALLGSVTDFAKWSQSVEGSTYEFINKGNKDKNINPLLRKNTTYGFACYALNTTVGGALSLYKQGSAGTTYYLTGESVVADDGGNVYSTLADALEAADEGSTLTLLKTVAEDVTVSKNMTLDLAGFCVDGTVTVADGCTLCGKDTRTDDFTVEDAYGYGQIKRVSCQGTGAVTGLPSLSDSTTCDYLMITQADGISFHRVDLHLTSMSLRSSSAGVYYKSNFAGDEVVAAHVKEFGVALSVAGVPTAQTIQKNCLYSVFTGFTPGSNSGDTTSTLLKGIMKETNTDAVNSKNANVAIYGRAYLLTDDNRYAFGNSAARTLRQQTEGADALWEKLSDSQRKGLQDMYTLYEAVMQQWAVPNLKGSIEPDTPVQTGYVQVTSADQLTTGQYVMVLDTGYAPGVYENGWLTAVQPTVSENMVTEPAGAVWTLTFDGSSVTLTDANGVTVAPKSGNNNGIKEGNYLWDWSFADGTVTFSGTGSDTVKLASNATASGGNKFRGYKNTTVSDAKNYPSAFTLYKLTEE